ncbi:hypothetical protein J8K84_13310 [Bacteroides fragilis]|mgnify:CR=1 FL=1|jgi:hypothetical protein|uniref:hypothetical protein n=1 Tax=Bacteroides fragilis TaxID=817 RepID=UPI001C7300F5|nr:hypothetical protein [Bacteroides fragilis]MCM0251881.1 hypothetical protein [Bacteroides fragilis]MCM0336031.1 hypothetical protein [Bacteroides fragilis]
MGRCKITAINDDIDGSTMLNVRINNKRLFIARSSIDKALPEMYNYDGEQLFFVEVPYDALIVDGIERASGKARTVMTLAKIEQSIAAGGKSYKINPAYGVETSQIESYSFTTKGGEVMTVTPQEGQYRFYSNRGITKILGILEQTGNLLDIVSILNFGMNSDNKKELLPIPGPLGVLNLPMKRYLDETDEILEHAAKEQLKRAKKEGIKAIRKLVDNRMYQDMGYGLLDVSNDVINRIMENEFNTIEEVDRFASNSEPWTAAILYRKTEDNLGEIATIEAFFFNIE